MINFLYNIYPVEELIPSLINIYKGMEETAGITIRIINETFVLDHYSNIKYVDNYKNIRLYSSAKNPAFLDIDYWSRIIKERVFFEANYTNHFNWNFIGTNMNIKFEKSVLWVDSYPIAGYNYIWPIDFTSVFKVKFQGFIVPNMVDIDYMSKASLQHHDYASNTVFSLNVLFHKNMHTVNQHDYGFFLLWYEHYGSVEIGLKVAFSYWYQLWYPQLEEMVCIMDVPLGRTPTLLSDKVYSFKLFRIYEDIRKMPKFHYIYA